MNLDFKLLKTQIEQIQDDKHLKWQDWTRYSSRQDQKMKLGGVIGQWQFKNLSPELAKLFIPVNGYIAEKTLRLD